MLHSTTTNISAPQTSLLLLLLLLLSAQLLPTPNLLTSFGACAAPRRNSSPSRSSGMTTLFPHPCRPLTITAAGASAAPCIGAAANADERFSLMAQAGSDRSISCRKQSNCSSSLNAGTGGAAGLAVISLFC
jgi:hypothetical protein